MGASTAGGGCKNRDFRPISSFITDMIQHKAILLNVEIGTGMQSTATARVTARFSTIRSAARRFCDS